MRCLDLEKPRDVPAGVEFIEGDNLDALVLGKACKGVDTVFHLMDVKSPKHHGRRHMRKINIKGTGMLLKAAQAAGVKEIHLPFDRTKSTAPLRTCPSARAT